MSSEKMECAPFLTCRAPFKKENVGLLSVQGHFKLWKETLCIDVQRQNLCHWQGWRPLGEGFMQTKRWWGVEKAVIRKGESTEEGHPFLLQGSGGIAFSLRNAHARHPPGDVAVTHQWCLMMRGYEVCLLGSTDPCILSSEHGRVHWLDPPITRPFRLQPFLI